MIEKCRALREVMPQFSMFGTDNWAELDKQIEILESCKELTEQKIKQLISFRVEMYEENGQDWYQDAAIKAYDWVVNDTDDLVEDDDLEIFTRKKSEALKNSKS